MAERTREGTAGVVAAAATGVGTAIVVVATTSSAASKHIAIVRSVVGAAQSNTSGSIKTWRMMVQEGNFPVADLAGQCADQFSAISLPVLFNKKIISLLKSNWDRAARALPASPEYHGAADAEVQKMQANHRRYT